MKNNLLKRWVSFILAISIISSFTFVNVQASEFENTETIISEHEHLLGALGIIDINKYYNPNDFIDRISFIKYLLAMMKVDLNNYPVDAQLFIDVPTTHPDAKYANAAFKCGISFGYDNGNLGINDEVSANDATIMICRAMGYQHIAENFVGNDGYSKLANSLELYKNVSTVNGVLRNVDAAEMIYNAMVAPMFTTYNFKDYVLSEDSTIMGSSFDISFVEDIVSQDATGSIYNSDDFSKDAIIIHNNYYEVSKEYSSGFLGKKVRAYYTGENDDERKIVYMYVRKDNNILELSSEDVIKHNAEKISYEDNKSNRIKYVDISPYAITIKNGNILKIGENTDLSFKNADYMLIDNNNDKKYDVIIIKEYRTAVVKNISLINNTIYDLSSRAPSICLDDYDDYAIFDVEGQPLELKDIAKDNVLQIEAAENKRYIQIIVINSIKEAEVKTIHVCTTSKDEQYYSYQVSGDIVLRTNLDFDLYVNTATIKAGVKYKFLLDAKGQIIAAKNIDDISKYGWLRRVYRDDFDEIQIQVFTDEGVWETLGFANKIRLNGSRVDADTFMSKIGASEQLIRYRTNSDNALLDVELENNNGTKERFVQKASIPNVRDYGSRYYSKTKLIGGKIAIDSNTRIFVIPEDGSKDNYMLGDESYIATKYFYPLARGYIDANKESEYVDCLVYSGNKQDLQNATSTSIMIVDKIKNVYNEETSEIHTTVCGYMNDEYTEYMLEEGMPCQYTTANGVIVPVEEGDIIRFSIDINKMIVALKVIYDESTGTVYGKNDTDDENVAYGTSDKIYYGTPYSKLDGFIRIISESTGAECEYMLPAFTTKRIYQYDASERFSNVHLITVDDIETLTENSALQDKIVIVTYYETVLFIGVYKK